MITTIIKAAVYIFFIIQLLYSTVAFTNSPVQTTAEQKKVTLEILSTLEKRHFVDMPINDDLSAEFLQSYLDRLDPNKTFFLQTDIDEFMQKQYLLDDELKKGDNNTGFSIYHRLVSRMSTRLEKNITELQNMISTIDFTIDENIKVDDESAQWPKTTSAADELWRLRIKSYFLTQKLAEKPIEEANETLVKRYEAQLKRIQENSAEDIYEMYINAFTELYDPHTNYFSPRASESFSIRMSLSLEGIGAVLQTEDGYTKVVRVITAGPADKQGQLKPSDRISGVAQDIDGEMINVVGWRLDDVVNLIRGPKGSIVRLEITSDTSTESATRTIEIKREKVKLEDQAAQKAIITMDDNGKPFKVGVINIPTFYLDFDAYRKRDPNYRSTTKDVYRLINELEEEGVDGIVMDLRNNGGGSLYEATAVTDLFIDKGPVVQIGKSDGKNTSDYSQNEAHYRGPLVVLINRLSASASEIFAGAIQDYHRGIVVGSQSFGKGTVQTLTPLSSQGELKITESKFYRVSGESTQHRGVIPDITMPELVDVTKVGESSYDSALAWSKTRPVRHGTYFSLEPLLSELSKKHEVRTSNNPEFIYLDQSKALIQNINEKSLLSLQESQRRKEKIVFEQKSLTIENTRRKAKGLDEYKTFADYQSASDEKNEQRAASAGTTRIDTSDDAILQEAGYILKDFIDLLTQKNKKVAVNP